jgi:hypothetical protein
MLGPLDDRSRRASPGKRGRGKWRHAVSEKVLAKENIYDATSSRESSVFGATAMILVAGVILVVAFIAVLILMNYSANSRVNRPFSGELLARRLTFAVLIVIAIVVAWMIRSWTGV